MWRSLRGSERTCGTGLWSSHSRAFEPDIREAYEALVDGDPQPESVSWAVRSSATAEDLPDASFAGQQETFLNISGIENILLAIRNVFASLYNDRAIAYRVHHGFDHHDVALSAGVQRMVRSDVGASGVLFTVDTESGFDQAVFITSSYGLGEAVVQGAVNPDEFYAYKPALRAGRPAILKRSVGEKAVKMVYADGTHVGGSTVFTDVPQEDRAQFSITDAEVEDSDARPWSSRTITGGRWTSSGARTASTGSSTSSRRAPRRSSPALMAT